MNKFILVSLVSIFSVSALATSIQPVKDVVNCTVQYANGPISGYVVNIYQEKLTGKKHAVTYPICRTCRVIPQYYNITSESPGGMRKIYRGTEGFKLDITLESVVQTETHYATAYVPSLKQSLRATCTFVK
jgi:hypothetical protein